MKIWLIVTLATVGVLAAQSTPKNGVTKEQVGSSAQKPSAADEEHSDSKVTVIVKQQNTPEHQQEKQQDAEDVEIQKSNLNLTRWLIAVGFIQAAILAFTIRAINRQNETSKSIERAWIMAELRCSPVASVMTGTRIVGEVESVSTSAMGVELYCVNDGNSPGWITEKLARLVIVKEGELPATPHLTPADAIQSEIEPLGPGRDSIIKWDATGEGKHSPMTAATLIYGVVKYRDIFKKQRETWFCYQVTGYRTNRKMNRISGNPGYNKNT